LRPGYDFYLIVKKKEGRKRKETITDMSIKLKLLQALHPLPVMFYLHFFHPLHQDLSVWITQQNRNKMLLVTSEKKIPVSIESQSKSHDPQWVRRETNIFGTFFALILHS